MAVWGPQSAKPHALQRALLTPLPALPLPLRNGRGTAAGVASAVKAAIDSRKQQGQRLEEMRQRCVGFREAALPMR